MKSQVVTVYINGMMGVRKYVGKLIDHGRKSFAQYASAPYVNFIPKGKRKVTGYIEGYDPYILILEGDGHPEPAGMFGKQEIHDTGAGLVGVSHSLYSSADPRWKTDFDAIIDPYINSGLVKVIADYRRVKTYEPLPQQVA